MKKYISIILFFISFTIQAQSHKVQYNSASAGNPIIPGYFADPTIRKFGDTYYLYSTTDGNGGGKGPSQVWISKDFQNWTMMPMNWPTSLFYWAPDVMKRNDKYYLYYCQPSCEVFCGVADTPRGPWENIFGKGNEKSLIPDKLVTGAITLDGQTFVDDDGSTYIYFGTWGIYEGFGCGVAKLSSDLKTVVEKRLIPNTEAKDFFEAPYVIKKNGVYFFTYSSGSCHDETYRVQYATSTVGPMGPFVFAANNPILATSADKSIHGPGHHSILEEGGNYYIIYHRHNIPNSTRGMHRQIAADKLMFMSDGTIQKVEASHQGIGALKQRKSSLNLAYGKPVKASSYYSEDFKPAYAVDDNNATLWRPRTCGTEWIEIDLGKEEPIQRVLTQFEYPTTFYQYIIETSLDGKTWTTFSDKRTNLLSGSPMTDYGKARARYVRLSFTGAEKNGVSGALWNIKVYGETSFESPQTLIDLAAINLKDQTISNDYGMLGGIFHAIKGEVSQRDVEGRKTIVLSKNTELAASFEMPSCLSDLNEYTLSYQEFGSLDQILKEGITWLDSQQKLFSKGAVKTVHEPVWHTIAVTSDGKREILFIDGREQASQNVKKSKQHTLRIVSGMTEKIITDMRVSNWCKDIVEINFDTTSRRMQRPATAARRKGLLLDINASDYLIGDEVVRVKNTKGIQGSFVAQEGSLPVTMKKQRIAFEFDGTQWLHSDFGLPETMEGNTPYSIAAWIMNPDLSDIECILDINEAGGEQEKVVFGYGKDESAGVVAHHAGYEDMGLKGLVGTSDWVHLVATYDGYKERIYINGNLMKEKDIVLRVPTCKKLFIGKNFGADHPYTGWLSTLSLYDIPLSASDIQTLYKQVAPCNVLLDFQAASLPYKLDGWKNEGVWGGELSGSATANSILDIENKIVLGEKFSMVGINNKGDNNAGSIVCEFFPTKGLKELMAWTDFSLSYDGMKKMVCIRNKKQLFKISTNDVPATGWMQLVLVPKQKVIYVNGIKLKLSEDFSISVLDTSISLGSPKCYLSKAAVYVNELSEPQAKEAYLKLAVNDLKEPIQVKARAASNQSVRFMIENKKDKLEYYYCNLTTGNSSGWTKLPYYMDDTVRMNNICHYVVKAKDRQGNVITCLNKSITVSDKSFVYQEDNFSTAHDYVSEGCKGTIWTALSGFDLPHFKVKADNNELELNSSKTFFNYERKENGPMLYQTIAGDFVAQIKISDFSGFNNKKSVGLNEGGLMVMSGEDSEYWVMHLSAFPYWNAGNLLTYLTKYGRPQYANKKGWDFDRYFQVERCGDYFFFRTSVDGKIWKDMPQSPIYDKNLNGKPVKVGPYQSTNSADYASVKYKEFRLWKKAK